MTIRDATEGERERLRDVLGDSYRDAFHHAAGAPLAEAEVLAEAAIRAPLAEPIADPWRLRVVEVSGQPVLGAWFGSIARRTKLMTVMQVWLDPTAEDPDPVSRRLLADLDAFAAAEGAARIQFCVMSPDDRVLRACEAAGYTARSVLMTKRLQTGRDSAL